MKRKILVAVLTLGLATCLPSCASSSVKCEKYAQLAPKTGLLQPMNSAQSDSVRTALQDKKFKSDVISRQKAHLKVIAYCNIYDGVASGNKSQPIAKALS